MLYYCGLPHLSIGGCSSPIQTQKNPRAVCLPCPGIFLLCRLRMFKTGKGEIASISDTPENIDDFCHYCRIILLFCLYQNLRIVLQKFCFLHLLHFLDLLQDFGSHLFCNCFCETIISTHFTNLPSIKEFCVSGSYYTTGWIVLSKRKFVILNRFPFGDISGSSRICSNRRGSDCLSSVGDTPLLKLLHCGGAYLSETAFRAEPFHFPQTACR